VILRLWLLVVLTLAGAFAPSRAGARTAETRTGDFFAATANARPESAPQVADSRLGFEGHGYELAPGYSQAAETTALKPGSFSIVDWTGYPSSIPKPTGPFQLLEGAEYDAARSAANSANRALHAADESLGGWQLHEIQPVKFGGDPINLTNKMPLPAGAHSEVTNWWNALQRSLEGPP
jgi:hypothetical protein